jgi:PAS domain S-box-containing protein
LLGRGLLNVPAATARKQAEAALRESEERYRTIFELSPSGIIVVSPDSGTILDCNDTAARNLGYSREELTRLRIADIDALESPADVLAHIARVRAAGHERFATRQRTMGGELREVVVEARPVTLNGRTAMLAVFEDVTERKRLEEQRQQFVSLVENSTDFIGMCDLEFKPFYLNAAGMRMVGLESLAQVRQTPVWEFLFPEDRRVAMEQFFPRVLREGLREMEIRFRHFATGAPIWMLWSVFTLQDSDGRPSGYATVSRDITERRRLDDALRNANRRKDEFLATLAHELRNPLAPIRNAVDILKLQGSADSNTQAACDILDRHSRQLVRLVDDLLDVNRIGRGKLQLRRERVELSTVLAEALEGASPRVLAAGQELSVSLPPEPVCLDADPVRLAQAFVNLLNNASKYTDRGGRIRVSAERNAAAGVAVTVADTGIGIAPEQLARIFDMFTQARASATDPQPGFGIGLALAQGLVEMHGGRIEARSEGAGCGSAFVVYLPVVDDTLSAQPAPAGDAEDHTAGAARRLLVVDDEQLVAKSLAVLLRLLGHAVEVAHDGFEAIAAAERSNPDVILLDVGMPKLDGYAVCRRIREQPWGKAMRIVALTGWGMEEDRPQSAEAGFDGHLVKPVDASTLSKLLREPLMAKR